MSKESNVEELLAAQRKERKDLIAKTQKLKHSVPKGDKKKKKEVTAEIAQMLAELDIKHKDEVEILVSNTSSAGCSSEKAETLENIDTQDSNVSLENRVPDAVVQVSDEDKKTTQKLSKAQKRRNKKAALEKERSHAIAEQEQLNLSGLRHLESEQINKKLSERNLTIYEIPSDGDCLYKAVEHQLSVLNLKPMTVQNLRKETSQYMLAHMNDFMPFITCPETGDALNEEMYIKYCEEIATTCAWGGHAEVQALSHICDATIEIIQAEGPSVIAGDENTNPKLILTYHRHVYGLGEHYNSVIHV